MFTPVHTIFSVPVDIMFAYKYTYIDTKMFKTWATIF